MLQAKIARSGMTEAQLTAAGALNEEAPPEADQQTEFDWKLELERNKLQVQNEGRQLWVHLGSKDQGGDPASGPTLDPEHKRLGSLEATQLAAFYQQEEHALQASVEPHEPKL